jgi:release factor glutamine methyltransferase
LLIVDLVFTGVRLLDIIHERLLGVSGTANLDAQVLLGHVLGRRRAWVLAHPEVRLNSDQEKELEAAMARLIAGAPLPYVLGHWEFYGLDFMVSPATLIPRPETELLVEKALDWLHERAGRRWAADVGSGSGCIGVALAYHIPDLQVIATDLSLAALQVARQNALKYRVNQRIYFVQSDLLASSDLRFDLICANLPYIPTHKLEVLTVARSEPVMALDGGSDGLDLARRLLDMAVGALAPGGLLLLEIEASQGAAARSLARAAFPQGSMQVLTDLAGHERLLVVQG